MRVSGHSDDVRASDPSDELADADELIADLAALLDAGVLVVHESVLGPARYGLAPTPYHRHIDDRRAYVNAA